VPLLQDVAQELAVEAGRRQQAILLGDVLEQGHKVERWGPHG